MTGRPLYEDGILDAVDAAMDVSMSLTRSSVYADVPNEQLLNDVDFQEYKVGFEGGGMRGGDGREKVGCRGGEGRHG